MTDDADSGNATRACQGDPQAARKSRDAEGSGMARMATGNSLVNLAVIAVLAACTAQPDTSADVAARAPVTPPAPGAVTPLDPPAADQCRAAERQSWVGRSVDELPQPPAGANWRRTCTTCSKTDDLRSDRLNIIYDQTTRQVVALHCG